MMNNADVEPWTTYPSGLADFDETDFDDASVARCLKDPEDIIFSDDSSIHVRIVDIVDNVPTAELCTNLSRLTVRIDETQPKGRHVRLISVHSLRTYKPLQITSTAMRKILHKYEVDPDFIRVIASFGEQPHVSEACSSFATARPGNNSDVRISYKINYVEENFRGGHDPWSFRHIGMYHHHRADSDFFLVLHSNQGGTFEERAMKMLGLGQPEPKQKVNVEAFLSTPFRLHNLVLSSFLGNWRPFLRDLGDRFSKENNRAMVIKPEAADAGTTFRSVQALRNINDIARFARACCASNVDMVQTLADLDAVSTEDGKKMRSQTSILQGYVESSAVLISRIQNALDLAGYTLNVYNQLETAKVERELRDMTGELRDTTDKLRKLTESSVDDSATVKIITVVSSVYLPGSFVGTLYGMNFFKFVDSSNNIKISQDAWIFAATWIPLTLLTAAVYLYIIRREAKKRGKDLQYNWFGYPKEKVPV